MIAITTTSLRRYLYRSFSIAFLVLTPWIGHSRSAIANPNNSQPDAYLDIHGVVPEAVQLGAECIQAFESFRDLVYEIDKKFDSKKFSSAFVAYQKFLRLNARLKLCGEPLSYDLQLRRTDPEVRLNAIRSSYLPTQDCSEIVQRIAVELRKKEKLRIKLVEQIRELMNKQKWDEAEALWDKTMGSLWQQLAFLDGQLMIEFSADFYKLDEDISPMRARERTSVFHKAIEAKHQEHFKTRKSLLDSARSAPGQLLSAGKADLQGTSLSGSALAKQLVIAFGPLHADLMHDASLSLLKDSISQDGSSYSDSGQTALVVWRKQAESSANDLKDSLIAIVNAESQSGAALNKGDYVGYLNSIAIAMNRLAPDVTPRDFQPALDSVAKKAGLDKPLQAYREATRDVLIWRGQIAARLADHQKTKGYPEIDQFTRENLWKNEAGVPLMSPSVTETPIPTLLQPIPKSVRDGWENVRGKSVCVGGVVRFDSDKELLMSRLQNGTYARPVGSTRSVESMASLKRELLMDDTHPALELTAAHALHEAESGEAANAGGEILSLNLEASSTRMLKLPAIAGNFLRYSAIQNPASPRDELSGLCIRFDLKPKWIATHYQFVRLP